MWILNLLHLISINTPFTNWEHWPIYSTAIFYFQASNSNSNIKTANIIVRPLSRKDIFYSRSIYNMDDSSQDNEKVCIVLYCRELHWKRFIESNYAQGGLRSNRQSYISMHSGLRSNKQSYVSIHRWHPWLITTAIPVIFKNILIFLEEVLSIVTLPCRPLLRGGGRVF